MSSVSGSFHLFQTDIFRVTRRVDAIYRANKSEQCLIGEREKFHSIGWIFLHRQRHLRTDLADRPSFKGEKDVGDVIKFIYWNSTVSAIQRHEIHFPSNFSWFHFDSSISAICERFKPVLLFRVHFPRKMCLLQLAMVSAIYATIYSFTWRPERRWVSRVCRCNLKRAADCNFPPTDTLTIQHNCAECWLL